ncbi:Methyltransferase-like protein [Actinidia chinensis var. chinensis]|uniref:Methyltransferase-like protein n=1 Tax=Actinidia chinensis var. chinensis TaxID=1590841 RepID=A0A2R6S038_ACTCC|nr:Methyltransferase-like protein [Actinidia chinensis var. chinensis]
MWKRMRLSLRRFSTATRRRVEDEGDWCYSSEWWGNESDGHTVLRSISEKGNGVVSVIAYPSSRPSRVHWPRTHKWLQQRYAEIHPDSDNSGQFKVLGYQWRTLRFNDDTRQSTVKIMSVCMERDPSSLYFMQQARCLAVPYLKSMVSAGLATLASCNYNLERAVLGKNVMKILCIGHGGGSLPLFLASMIQGAVIHIVEIDPVVISASIHAMGFPSGSVMTSSGVRAVSKPDLMNEVLWKGIHERLFLYESDAENFILNTTNLYDIVFIDAYDGEDIFPRKLWDPHSPFLNALGNQVHPEHGTVVVNLHADSDIMSDGSVSSVLYQILPMGKYVSGVCRAYKDVLVNNGSGFAFNVSVPWVCNSSLVVCRSSGISSGSLHRDLVLNTLLSKSLELENILNLPFSCLEYIKRGFALVD